MSPDKLLEYIIPGLIIGILIWLIREYIQMKTQRHSIKESDVNMGYLEEHCKERQASCQFHYKLESIENRLLSGDETLAKHTEAIRKLDIGNLSKMINGVIEINDRVIGMLDKYDFDKKKTDADILELQNNTDFLKAKRI